jgi:hypothetical protein
MVLSWSSSADIVSLLRVLGGSDSMLEPIGDWKMLFAGGGLWIESFQLYMQPINVTDGITQIYARF